MFIAGAIPIGLIVGRLVGGRFGRLADLRLRWAWLAVAGLVLQIGLFNGPLGPALDGLAPLAYVISNVAVMATVLRNLDVAGMPIVAAGGAANLVAILANGGAMPADPVALAASGIDPSGYTNSVTLTNPVLRPLTDIFAIPAGLPLANVFSIGDVLIGIGIAAVLALAMRRPRVDGTADLGQPAPAGTRD